MAELETRERKEIPKSQYVYVDRSGGTHLPLHDESHVRNAMSRYNQTEFESMAAKERARLKILRAAHRHRIEIGEDEQINKRVTSLRAASTKRGPRGGRKKSV